MGLRQERLADEIRDILAACFLGDKMQDPRLANVTITAVKLSGDLQIATVYFRVMSEDGEAADAAIEEAHAGLESARGFLRNQISGIDVRRIPTLRFFYDESVERGARIEYLLTNLDKDE